jgi:hypothetical protein
MVHTEELLISKFHKIKTRLDLMQLEEEIEDNAFSLSLEDYRIIKQALIGKRKMMDENFFNLIKNN